MPWGRLSPPQDAMPKTRIYGVPSRSSRTGSPTPPPTPSLGQGFSAIDGTWVQPPGDSWKPNVALARRSKQNGQSCVCSSGDPREKEIEVPNVTPWWEALTLRPEVVDASGAIDDVQM